jgi:hypothetical protein
VEMATNVGVSCAHIGLSLLYLLSVGDRRGGAKVGEDGSMLPFLFWRVSVGRRRPPPSGAAEVEVSRGDSLTCVSPRVLPRAPT